MLTPDYLEHCTDEAIKINAELENFIIQDIARRIVQAGTMTETARHQIRALQENGNLYNEIIEEIAKITKRSETTVKKIFEDATIESMTFDDKIYELAGLKPTAFRESPSIMQILKTGIQKANGDIHNLIMTTAGTSQSKFTMLSNMAYRQYTSGAFDYNTAIFNAVEQLSKDGIDVLYPSGKTDKIDVAVRRALLTGVNQTANELQDQRAEEMGTDLFEITAHAGARVTKKQDWTNHAWWQGKVYSISGNSDKYPALSVTGYKIKIDGLAGINCRHNKFPFIEGVSRRAYTDEELEKINNKTVKYNGREVGEYEALQTQRKMERDIREIKRTLSGYQGIMFGTEDETLLNQTKNKFTLCSKKLKSKEAELKDFVEQTGLKRDTARERVVGFNKSISQKAVNTSKVGSEYLDITNEIKNKENPEYIVKEQQYFIDESGNRYNVDNKNVKIKANEKEREVADLLGRTYGGQINLVPVVLNPKGIKTPDYSVNGEKFDLKEVFGNGKNTLDTAISKKRQQSNNFIFDISKTNMKKAEAIEQIKGIYKSEHRKWVSTIILIKDKEILKVYQRK